MLYPYLSTVHPGPLMDLKSPQIAGCPWISHIPDKHLAQLTKFQSADLHINYSPIGGRVPRYSGDHYLVPKRSRYLTCNGPG